VRPVEIPPLPQTAAKEGRIHSKKSAQCCECCPSLRDRSCNSSVLRLRSGAAGPYLGSLHVSNDDDSLGSLFVTRSVWRGHVGDPKPQSLKLRFR